MELTGMAARTRPSTVEPAGPDTPSRQAKDSSIVIQRLLHASLETWYHAIWLPRCQRTISQERSQGLHQGAKLRRMRARQRGRARAAASPTVKLPGSFIGTNKERMHEHHRFMDRWMHGTL